MLSITPEFLNKFCFFPEKHVNINTNVWVHFLNSDEKKLKNNFNELNFNLKNFLISEQFCDFPIQFPFVYSSLDKIQNEFKLSLNSDENEEDYFLRQLLNEYELDYFLNNEVTPEDFLLKIVDKNVLYSLVNTDIINQKLLKYLQFNSISKPSCADLLVEISIQNETLKQFILKSLTTCYVIQDLLKAKNQKVEMKSKRIYASFFFNKKRTKLRYAINF